MRTVTARPWLNVRDEPSLAGQIVGQAETGRRVVVFDEIAGPKYKWLEVGFDGGVAFLAKKWTTPFYFENWPCESRLVNLNNLFGANPERYKRWGLPGHEGLDIIVEHGAEIFAVADGIVYKVEDDPGVSNYGIHVRIEHIDYHRTIYAHFAETVGGIAAGEFITAGTIIGYGDSTGNSFGTHLHFTLKAPYAPWNWPGDQIDPWPYLAPIA
jgi:murein DD-endopeptidase MepM/ murein hydrolase activator NlpD